MSKSMKIIISVVVVAIVIGVGYIFLSSQSKNNPPAADQNVPQYGESAIPQSGDLCEGTGGNGQITSVGNNAFTIKLNDGNSQIINLTGQATIKTSNGSVSPSDLKIGDRVTIAGHQDSDGSFTANIVVVCKVN